MPVKRDVGLRARAFANLSGELCASKSVKSSMLDLQNTRYPYRLNHGDAGAEAFRGKTTFRPKSRVSARFSRGALSIRVRGNREKRLARCDDTTGYNYAISVKLRKTRRSGRTALFADLPRVSGWEIIGSVRDYNSQFALSITLN